MHAAALAAGVALAASVLAGCSSARTNLGTVDESCYLQLPTAAKAVGSHAHLAGVRKFTVSSLKPFAPRMYAHLSGVVPKGQNVCLAAYTGHFTASSVQKPRGRSSGKLAVAVVTSPGNELLGTVILNRVPVRFQHTF
jgi:hypothetical protein